MISSRERHLEASFLPPLYFLLACLLWLQSPPPLGLSKPSLDFSSHAFSQPALTAGPSAISPSTDLTQPLELIPQTQPDVRTLVPFQDSDSVPSQPESYPLRSGFSSFPNHPSAEQYGAGNGVPISCIHWAKCLSRASCQPGWGRGLQGP